MTNGSEILESHILNMHSYISLIRDAETKSSNLITYLGEANQIEQICLFAIGFDYNGEFDPGSG